MLSDETNFLPLLDATETEFASPTNARFVKNSKDYGLYPPIYSVSVTLSADYLTINRKTDNLLDWMGDWGGLIDGLSLIAEIIINNY